jgi:hypothetical protein
MAFFWVVAPRSLVEVFRRFRGACSLHHQTAYSPPWKPEISLRCRVALIFSQINWRYTRPLATSSIFLVFQSSRTTAACRLVPLMTLNCQRSTEPVTNSAWAAEALSKRRDAIVRSMEAIWCMDWKEPHPASCWLNSSVVNRASKLSWCGSERNANRGSLPGRGDGLTVGLLVLVVLMFPASACSLHGTFPNARFQLCYVFKAQW